MLGFKHRPQAFNYKKDVGVGHCQASVVSQNTQSLGDITILSARDLSQDKNLSLLVCCITESHTVACYPLSSVLSLVSVTWKQEVMIVTASFYTLREECLL